MRVDITTLFGLGYLRFSASISSLVAGVLYATLIAAGLSSLIAHGLLWSAVLVWSGYALYRRNWDGGIGAGGAVAPATTDPPEVVVDEFLGMYACLAIAASRNPSVVVALFVVFRLLDVLKPPPLRALDRAVDQAWWGSLIDDIVIGVVVALLYRIGISL